RRLFFEPGCTMTNLSMTTKSAFAGRELLSSRAIPDEDWEQLLEAAEALSGDAGRRPLLAGKRFGLLLLNPSLRTRTSFTVACFDLGALAVALTPGQGLWQLAHDNKIMDGLAAEHVAEAIPVLGEMLDGLGVRAFAALQDAAVDASEPVFSAIVKASSVPVLNLESAVDHPHQGLADALAARRYLNGARSRVVVRWAPHIKPLPRAVPNSALCAFAREGHDVVLVHPPGFDLDEGVLNWAQDAARRNGGSLTVTHDKDSSLQGARIVYAKSWGRSDLYGDAEQGAAAVAGQSPWRVTSADLQRTAAAGFMHCLPVRRGVVADADVLESSASLVIPQASARLDVQRATLCRASGVQL
ncbi:MAG: N-acetylornithine carbamoyltransferase, partial [Pseudohongiellaceae bacterium]